MLWSSREGIVHLRRGLRPLRYQHDTLPPSYEFGRRIVSGSAAVGTQRLHPADAATTLQASSGLYSGLLRSFSCATSPDFLGRKCLFVIEPRVFRTPPALNRGLVP